MPQPTSRASMAAGAKNAEFCANFAGDHILISSTETTQYSHCPLTVCINRTYHSQ